MRRHRTGLKRTMFWGYSKIKRIFRIMWKLRKSKIVSGPQRPESVPH